MQRTLYAFKLCWLDLEDRNVCSLFRCKLASENGSPLVSTPFIESLFLMVSGSEPSGAGALGAR